MLNGIITWLIYSYCKFLTKVICTYHNTCYNYRYKHKEEFTMKDRYYYPAVLAYDDDGISVVFPDLPGCVTCGDSTEDAVSNAKEAMGLHLYGMEKDNDVIPQPTAIKDIKIEGNEVLMLIEVYMPILRDAIENTAIKKTLTIPQWLNEIAEENRINYSQVLQAALKEKLNIRR